MLEKLHAFPWNPRFYSKIVFYQIYMMCSRHVALNTYPFYDMASHGVPSTLSH